MRAIALAAVCLACSVGGCAHVYEAVDTAPDGSKERFQGIRDYLDAVPQLHVLQTHGMGDNRAESFCAPGGENLHLQAEVVRQLGYQALPHDDAPGEHSIKVGQTKVGSYSTRVYVDDVQLPRKSLYFSCLTWGDASREVKLKMLELDPVFHETNEHEQHRALINRKAKHFVNESFSDPMLYAGPFGQLIRDGVWQGMQEVGQAQRRNQARVASLGGGVPPAADRAFLSQMPTVVISDSLGSRVLFDVLWTKDSPPQAGGELTVEADGQARALKVSTRRQIQSIFMLANQLPLLALAQLPPPPEDQPLDTWLDQLPCIVPYDPARAGEVPTTVVAMTDVNDALSYYLSADFKRRCAGSGVRFVNVTLTNAKPIFGLYADLVKAHASGFKTNPKAIGYLVDGN